MFGRRSFLCLPAVAALSRGRSATAADQLPSSLALQALGLERAWSTVVPLAYGREKAVRVNLDHGTLYVQTTSGGIEAFEAETGRLLWSTALGFPSWEPSDVSSSSTLAFVSNGQRIHALDKKTGRQAWSQLLPTFASGPTVGDDKLVTVGLKNGQLLGYSLVKPADSRFTFSGAPGGFAFAWHTNRAVTSRALLSEYVIAFGSMAGKVYVARRDPPVLLNRSQDIGAISGALAPYGTRTVIATTQDSRAYAFDLFTGMPKWDFPTEDPVDQEALVAGDSVYVVTRSGHMYCIDPETGNSKWSTDAGMTDSGRLLALSPKKIYLRSSLGDLIVLDRETGRPSFDARTTFVNYGLNIRPYGITYTNPENDRIYMLSPEGYFLCLREIGNTAAIPLRSPSAEPFGYIPKRAKKQADDAAAGDDAGAAAEGDAPDF